ncbi:uncharacterized protein BDZ83DRAFT_630661 [Colletotrichum acutatum]|uniref:Uncharacterized protein n=1 Tax=Glomerella acutata TaxID=27357 RepID=A0AAD8UHQ3_GLOAC|nr:uncharacterized protein BDZ83DRAFT_630661 [Colletotrichum acutatum]KAK1720424.1 hypothetical protein BDZ83DRAFT_630661 [Colletotrichum acutatum]
MWSVGLLFFILFWLGSIGNARGTLTSLKSGSMSIANGAVCQLARRLGATA